MSEIETIEARRVLRRGDWVSIVYGFERFDVYILRYSEDDGVVTWGMPDWCVSSSMTMRLEQFWSSWHDPIYIGHGKERWWRRLLPLVNDVICPFSRVV